MKVNIGVKFIIIILLVAIVVILSMIYIAYNVFSNQLYAEVSDNFLDNAFHTMDKLDRFMYERLSDIKLLASQNNPITNDQYSLNEKLNYLREVEKERKAYASMSIYDLNGIKLGDTRGINIGANEKDKSFFKEAINGNIYYDTKPIVSESLGIPVIHISGPIKNKNGTKLSTTRL